MLTSFHEIQQTVAMSRLCDDDIRDIADAVYRNDNPLRFESVRQAALMFERVGYTIARPPALASVVVPMRVVVESLVIDRSRYSVMYHGREVVLKPREFELLDVLARRASRLFTRQMLLELAWPHAYDGDERTVDVHVSRIRRKLAEPGLIRSVKGVGYKLVPLDTFHAASAA